MPAQRVAIIFEYPTLNGGERSMLSVLDQFQRTGSEFEIVAVAPRDGRLADSLKAQGIRHVAWSAYNDAGDRRPPAEIEQSLVATITSIEPDLVHANSLSMGRLLGRLANQLNVATTGHLRDIIKLSAAAISDLNQNQMLVAVSEATRQFHVKQGILESRITTVHNGVDLDRFQPRAKSGRLSAELSLNRDAVLIACIGQIGLRKGQDVLTTAAPSIIEKVPSAHFLLIGERTSQKAESVEFEQSICRRFAEAGIAPHLHMLGHREDVADVLNQIDLLLHPANQEPFGRVLLEASAAGVPIVATNVGGTSEIIIDGQTGRLIPPRNPDALAAAVIDILSNSANLQRLGENARIQAVLQFSVARAATQLATVWNSINPK